MKGSRQKSPGTVIRVDAMDESNINLITAEQDEFVPNIHLSADEDTVCYYFVTEQLQSIQSLSSFIMFVRLIIFLIDLVLISNSSR